MKKFFALVLAAALVAAPVAVQARETGGLVGGLVGCCFGVRTAGAYNDGKNLDIRDWIRIIPFVNIVGAVWDAFDGYNGITTAELAKTYPGCY